MMEEEYLRQLNERVQWLIDQNADANRNNCTQIERLTAVCTTLTTQLGSLTEIVQALSANVDKLCTSPVNNGIEENEVFCPPVDSTPTQEDIKVFFQANKGSSFVNTFEQPSPHIYEKDPTQGADEQRTSLNQSAPLEEDACNQYDEALSSSCNMADFGKIAEASNGVAERKRLRERRETRASVSQGAKYGDSSTPNQIADDEQSSGLITMNQSNPEQNDTLFEEIISKRGRPLLTFGGYQYTFEAQSSKRSNVEFWKCAKKSPYCPARAEVSCEWTKNNNGNRCKHGTITNSSHNHSHNSVSSDNVQVKRKVTFRFGETQRSNSICCDGYKYVHNTKHNNKIYWKCAKRDSKKCNARAITEKECAEGVVKGVHNHEPSPEREEVKLRRRPIKPIGTTNQAPNSTLKTRNSGLTDTEMAIFHIVS